MGKTVRNLTRQCVIAEDVRMADTYFRRLQGLMGRQSLPKGSGLWITPCNDIHSCFMRFEFDAIFLDRENTVLYVLERMKPWRVSRMVKGGRVVLEVPAGTIEATGTHVGDRVSLEDRVSSDGLS